MKILKIENGTGHFWTGGDADWKPIDAIDKEGLLELLDLFLDNDVEMDSPEEYELQNQAHAIIYGSLFERFGTLSENKRRFKDESERLYIDELKKYSSA